MIEFWIFIWTINQITLPPEIYLVYISSAKRLIYSDFNGSSVKKSEICIEIKFLQMGWLSRVLLYNWLTYLTGPNVSSPDPSQITIPVWLNNLFSVAHSSIPVLHIETDTHGLIHHVQHVDVGVSKYRSHLLEAELTHLQQLTGGCHRVKDTMTQTM